MKSFSSEDLRLTNINCGRRTTQEGRCESKRGAVGEQHKKARQWRSRCSLIRTEAKTWHPLLMFWTHERFSPAKSDCSCARNIWLWRLIIYVWLTVHRTLFTCCLAAHKTTKHSRFSFSSKNKMIKLASGVVIRSLNILIFKIFFSN